MRKEMKVHNIEIINIKKDSIEKEEQMDQDKKSCELATKLND
jgi:hypothetical protein